VDISSCQGHQEVLFVNWKARRRFKEHGVWMILSGLSIYNLFLFPLVGLASGLYHTVARSLATFEPSKLASDHLFLSIRLWTSRRLSSVTCTLNHDCYIVLHGSCIQETSGGASLSGSAG